eukprot:1140105-Pelagomonas_calceolata.AAC.3
MSDLRGDTGERAGGGHTLGGVCRPTQEVTSLHHTAAFPPFFPQGYGQLLLSKWNLNNGFDNWPGKIMFCVDETLLSGHCLKPTQGLRPTK